MATGGTATGSRTVTNGPQLRQIWERTAVDIPGNRSKVKLTVQIYSQYGAYFSASKSGSVNGTAFTYSGGMSGSGVKTVATKEWWVGHNSDGTKSFTASSWLDINLDWSSGRVNRISVSDTVNLDTIPRSSKLNSFSMGASLQVSTANTVNLSITRYSSSFDHNIELKYGSTSIATWIGQGLPTSLTLTATQVNNLLKRISKSTSGTMTLVIQTYSGSTKIGGYVSRTATASIHSSVVPSISGLSSSIYGTGRDDTIGKYVQGISRVSASYSRSEGYGSSIASSTLIIRKDSNHADSTTINSNSGTTGVVSSSGLYEAIATVKDARGRSATARTTFTVTAYSVPKIGTFKGSRNSSNDTIVNLTRSMTYSPLGTGDNVLTIRVYRVPSGGSGQETVQDTTTTSSSYTTGLNVTGHDAAQSYEYRMHITDSFGKNAESSFNVSTAKILIDKHEDLGVGILKYHERGALDVGGDVYVSGDVEIGVSGSESGVTRINRGGNSLQLGSTTDNGYAFMSWNKLDGSRSGYIGVPNMSTPNFIWSNEQGGTIDLRGADVLVNNTSIVASGSNSNGAWVRYHDGTQMVWSHLIAAYQSGSYLGLTWTYPAPFVDTPVTTTCRYAAFLTPAYNRTFPSASNYLSNSIIRYWKLEGTFVSGESFDIAAMAVGRWK